MNIERLFIEGYKLPQPLEKEEVYGLLDRIKQGDEQAKTKLIEHNIRLVLARVNGKFSNVNYEKQDLVSIGILGLLSAIETFDISKKVEFSTYAMRCIDNEILMFLRKLKRYLSEDSIDKVINCYSDNKEIKVEDTLSDGIDIAEEYMNNELRIFVRQIVETLPERDKKIVMLGFGFYNDKVYSQREISEMLSISQSQVSRITTKVLKQIGRHLEKNGFIEKKNDKVEIKKYVEENKSRKIKTIYEYFSSYSKEQIDIMLEKLSIEEKDLIKLRYGNDLNNPVSRKLTSEETKRFYGILIPKMNRLLSNPNKVRRTRTKKNKTVEIITKEDYINILKILENTCFTKIINEYSFKEVIIVFLKSGYIDGKVFSNSAISKFLGIEEQEIIDIITKVLPTHKEEISQCIDEVIKNVNEESKKAIIKQKIK